MSSSFDFYSLIIMIIPLVFGITVHEAAHGYAAKYCGDNTAAMLGRLSLNPIRHIDPIGTIAFPLGLYFLATIFSYSPFIFGWAKPVPVNPRNYSRFSLRKSDLLVSFAGPGSNFVMMFLWGLILGLSPLVPQMYYDPVSAMASYGVIINAVLFTLNMIPILPLDGGHILDNFLPPKWSMTYRKLNLGNNGFFLVMLLLYFGPTRAVFYAIVQSVASLSFLPALKLGTLFM